MDAETRTRAEARLEQAAAALGLADPRTPLRARLKQLREDDAEAFGRAVKHYEEQVLPALAGGDPLPAWLAYGEWLGRLSGEGGLQRIDEAGRATPCGTAISAGDLVLFIPAATGQRAFVCAAPAQPSAAQQATIELLVEGSLSLRS